MVTVAEFPVEGYSIASVPLPTSNRLVSSLASSVPLVSTPSASLKSAVPPAAKAESKALK